MKRDATQFLSSFVLGHKKIVIALFSLYFLTIVLALSVVYLSRRQVAQPKGVDGITSLTTAYGSQRHIFGSGDGLLVAVWINSNKQVIASYSIDNGVSWREAVSPLVSEEVETVSAALDQKGNLHLAYETQRKIVYRKISGVIAEGKINEVNWIVSLPVKLDLSRIAARPSLILDKETDLPMVIWTAGGVGITVRINTVRFMKAKDDPTLLANWCKTDSSSCGIPALVTSVGSGDVLGKATGRPTFLHPVLAQNSQNGDLYAFWSDNLIRRDKAFLKMAVARKGVNKWVWEAETVRDDFDRETSEGYDLTAVYDPNQNRVIVAYVSSGGNTKIITYKPDGTSEDLSPNQKFGSQFSLAASEGKIYLFYRNEVGKVALRSYDSVWSGPILETSGESGYPSSTDGSISGKIFFAYTNPDGKVEFSSFSLVSPTPTAIPSPEITPISTP